MQAEGLGRALIFFCRAIQLKNWTGPFDQGMRRKQQP
jgi:hypothetical protein